MSGRKKCVLVVKIHGNLILTILDLIYYDSYKEDISLLDIYLFSILSQRKLSVKLLLTCGNEYLMSVSILQACPY